MIHQITGILVREQSMAGKYLALFVMCDKISLSPLSNRLG